MYIPPIIGCATRSSASFPNRRLTNDAKLSSLTVFFEIKRSANILNFPLQENSGVIKKGIIFEGANIKNPSGTGTNFFSQRTYVPRLLSLVSINSSSSPTLFDRLSAHGLLVKNISGPSSIKKPSFLIVVTAPPNLLLFSIRITSMSRFFSFCNSVKRCAALSPVIPPPMTAIFLVI